MVKEIEGRPIHHWIAAPHVWHENLQEVLDILQRKGYQIARIADSDDRDERKTMTLVAFYRDGPDEVAEQDKKQTLSTLRPYMND